MIASSLAEIPKGIRVTRKWLWAIGILGCIGCSKEVQVHMYDKEALTALESYEPKYKLDEVGRVVEIRMEGKHIDDAAVEHLQAFTEVKTISLYGSSITDQGLKPLLNLGRLESLGLGKTQISDRGLVYLRQIPNLRWVWLSENRKPTKKGVADLKKACPKLRIYQ